MAFNKEKRLPLTHFKCDNNNNIMENLFLKSTVNHNSSLEDNWEPQQITLKKKKRKERLQSLFTYWKFLQNLIWEDGGKHKVQVLVFYWSRAASCPGPEHCTLGLPALLGSATRENGSEDQGWEGSSRLSAGFSGRDRMPRHYSSSSPQSSNFCRGGYNSPMLLICFNPAVGHDWATVLSLCLLTAYCISGTVMGAEYRNE